MGLRHACRSTESLGKRLLFLLDNMALVLGASKGRGGTPSLNHTCREICVISLAKFTIPVCRWIASETNPADEPSRSKRYRPKMHSDVESPLLHWYNRHKSRKDGYISENDAKKKNVYGTSSSASRFSSSRTEPPQPRFCVTQSRSTCF